MAKDTGAWCVDAADDEVSDVECEVCCGRAGGLDCHGDGCVLSALARQRLHVSSPSLTNKIIIRIINEIDNRCASSSYHSLSRKLLGYGFRLY